MKNHSLDNSNFDGTIDDVRLYSKALTADEITALYQQTAGEKRQFTGQEYDAATGLNYMNARYYDGAYGKFISQDPVFLGSPEEYISDPQQANSYSYARNNPLKYLDPTGETLVINGGSGFRGMLFAARTFMNLRNIYSGIGIKKADNGLEVTITKTTDNPGAGEKLMTGIVGSDKTVTIEKSSDKQNRVSDWESSANAQNGKGSNATIQFEANQFFNSQVPVTAEYNSKNGKVENKTSPSFLGLAHEMIHSSHIIQGNADFSAKPVPYTGLNGTIYWQPKEEVRTMGLGYNSKQDVTENDIRAEHGLNHRNNY